MKKQGAILVDPAPIESAGKFGDSEFTIFLYELKADLNAYLAKLGPNAPVKTLKEIIEFNEKNSSKEMPYFGQDMFLKSEEKGPLTTQEYIDAVRKRGLARKEGIDATMDKNNLDALVGPTGGPAWLTDHINGDSLAGELEHGGGGGVSEYHGAGGVCAWASRSGSVFWARLERAGCCCAWLTHLSRRRRRARRRSFGPPRI